MNNQISEEKQILQEEKEILKEIKKEEKKLFNLEKNLVIGIIVGGLAILALVVGAIYFRATSRQVYIEKSMISAPAISLSPTTAGALEEIFVHEGDMVLADTPVARVGNELIKTKTNGLITTVKDNVGKLIAAGEPVVTIIDPNELRVEGQIAEDKGLSDIRIGQTAMFKADAFGSKKYFGTVDEISPISRDSGVIFNISDKREVKNFTIKIRFNNQEYSELKSGMSAKVWIYKN